MIDGLIPTTMIDELIPCVVNGKTVLRPLAFTEYDIDWRIPRRVPKTTSNEQIVWIVGDDRAHIIKTKEDGAHYQNSSLGGIEFPHADS